MNEIFGKLQNILARFLLRGSLLLLHFVSLIRPSSTSPNLPKGVPVKAAISSITDERNLPAALVGYVVSQENHAPTDI